MLRVVLFVFIALVANPGFASKDKGVYVGAGIFLVDVGIADPFENNVNFKTGEIQLGYKYNPYLGIEVRGGRSLNDETIGITGTDSGLGDSASATIDEYFSVYYRAEIANEIAKLYVILGQTDLNTTVEFETDIEEFQGSDSGFSYGMGFGMWLDERMNLNFEIKSLLTTSEDSFTSGGITADYRF